MRAYSRPGDSSKVKILHVTPAFFPAVGGIETVVGDLVSHLHRKGIVADVLHMSPKYNKCRHEREGDGSVWRVPLFPNRLVGATPPIRSLLMTYDLLHVHDPQCMAITANVLAQGRGKRKLLSTHGGYFHTTNYSFAKQLHWRLLAGMILNRYDAVLASSAADCSTFKAKAPKVRLLANGVNVSKFNSIEQNRNLPATRWIYWGRLSQNKRIDLLIDTVKWARYSGLDVNLTIAGADFDGLLPSIRSRIGSYGLTDHIRITGILSDADLRAEIANHTVFVTASEYEGFGLGVIEAMAAGLLVVCRNMTPLNSFVVPGKNGIHVAFDGSSRDLASIKALCKTSPTEIWAMREFARATALPHSWDTVIKHYIVVYEEVMRL